MTWYEEFFGAVDGMDLDGVERQVTEDTVFQLANKEAIVGRQAVLEATSHFWTMIAGMKHEFINVVEDGDLAALEAICEYTRLDGSKVSIPVTTMVQRHDGKVAAQRIYIDIAPLFESAATAAPAGAVAR
jgi:ketosteroid isomerase-like protein